MKAVLRLGAALAASIALAPVSAIAQDAATTEAPAPETIGPRELQNFNLQGTVTRRADPPAPAEQAPPARPRAPEAQASTSPAPARATSTEPQTRTAAGPDERQQRTAAAEPRTTREASANPVPIRQTQAASTVTVSLPTLHDGVVQSSAAAPPATPAFSSESDAVAALTPERKFPIIPWLLAALALAGGAGFLFWRNRARPAFAGGPQFDAFVAPEPAPSPRPAPAPPRAAPRPAPVPSPAPAPQPSPAPLSGLVSTRLRPWIDVGFKPLRCVLDAEQVTIEFELELLNSGSGIARGILVEATLFNASNNQQEIENFFANPVAEGERILAIQPLQKVVLQNKVVVPRSGIQAYEIAGRSVFLPVIGFNTLYSWSGKEAQTSVSYLLGRNTEGEKLAPFQLDLGPRVFRKVDARQLPHTIRN